MRCSSLSLLHIQMIPNSLFIITLANATWNGDKNISAIPTNQSINGTSSLFSTSSYVILSINYPFFLVFVSLLVSSIVSYIMQRSQMKRNQHVLFALLFVLESLVCVNMLTRTSAELGFLHSDPNIGRIINAVIKIFDRCVVTSAVYMEIVIMCHISLVL